MHAAAMTAVLESQFIIVRYQHGLIGWLLVGLVAGWLAGKIARGRGFGCITDIILGLIGSYLGGWIFVKLGIFGGGFLYSLAAATLGAVILVSIAHLFSSGHTH
ncbi:MAG TPA: GlsB/YeaQ/YmgE family stress response membrane protein [Candidatus Acidoferrum sp.]|nr:GlsB/YeaQ/YmgE family stress response membrane protein [Candidatus Acidoferrum sp.]